MATPNMNLTLPVVSTTLGPTWASNLNTALEVVDAHDHTSGKGLPILTAALNINADLPLNGYRTLNQLAMQMQLSGSPLSGLSNINSISASAGNLYWTNSAGVAVQITSGADIVAGNFVLQSLVYAVAAADTTITTIDQFVVLGVNTSASRVITLPSATAVGVGRIYVIKDATGQAGTNNITIARSGSDTIDGATSVVLSTNNASLTIVSNGLNRFLVI